MKKALMIASILFVAVISTACINNIAVQELNNKAAEYMQKGDYEAAMSRLQASLDLDSTMYQTYYNLGVAAINAKKYEKAIEALEGGIKLNPDYPDFYYSLGVAQISLADEIIESDEENASAENNETISAEENKELQKEKIQKAVELKKDSIKSLNSFIAKVPNAKERTSVEEMIEQSEDFIRKNEELPVSGDENIN